jgi:hypothetical protein
MPVAKCTTARHLLCSFFHKNFINAEVCCNPDPVVFQESSDVRTCPGPSLGCCCNQVQYIPCSYPHLLST